MPNGWVHATLDLIAFGHPYLELHQKKDAPYKTLGPKHRVVNHEWYQAFEYKVWTHTDPFPGWLGNAIQKVRLEEGDDFAEERMVEINHEYIDRIWDNLDSSQRKYWEGCFAWVLFHPDVLKSWAGVDVVESKILRLIDEEEVWEYDTDLKALYENLCRYVQTVADKDDRLREMLRRYG